MTTVPYCAVHCIYCENSISYETAEAQKVTIYFVAQSWKIVDGITTPPLLTLTLKICFRQHFFGFKLSHYYILFYYNKQRTKTKSTNIYMHKKINNHRLDVIELCLTRNLI